MTESTPICRCRVLYLGSSVPHQTKDGLQGIQEPLQELYPDQGATGAKGIDSWLSVWSNGILLENVDENHKKITRFFPIESLHYCAAVRYVLVPEKNTLHAPSPKFLPLDSPFARTPNPTHPPLFAAILRRTTGIKVLECHAFICKREVAANALVRCCFHAYADSSYAKQVDTAGSIYGTLASERLTSKDKIDEWKMSRSQSGSTMTINTIGNGKDDVWAGSQDNLDGIYDLYSPSTLSRPSRPRQVAQPVAVPPPPAKEKKKKNKVQSKSLAGSREDLYHPLMNGKANSVSGTLMKPRQHSMPPQLGMPPGPPQPIYIVGPPPPGPFHQGTLPNPKFFKHHGNTFSHRPRGKMLIPARPIPPPMVPMIIPAPTTLKNKKKQKQMHMEEPIYMPSNRAMSPVASYQPVNFPHEAYLMQQYATMESQGKQRRSREKSMEKQGKLNKKFAQSMNGLDDPNLLRDDESPFNTGIYRKQGHLNERAFSYSIRQEHRSRSYGSLANLKFATPIPNGVHDDDVREDIKKEREIMQMVQDLDLSGDELERSEVPRGMYDPRGMAPGPGPVIMTGAQINGRGHRR
ncbi:uncharacterized protein LOC126746763 isoform X2 [Anthonomus grandis grandis]|uniref:uncharacterized protein LOC126746763 isoform X2 n=1 Tax=Anthonomus grandis grandis TaxID=2921223 RepID=UPI002165D85B|nr:uncharacterized protein LOC126746763 isoform X2 [Anthonomus grandis grandis]